MRRDLVFMHKQVVFVLTGILLSTVLNAQTWLPSKRLTWNLGDSDAPATITDSYNHTHVVWQDDTPQNIEIFYKKSTDGGATWTAAKRLTWTATPSTNPVIATDSNNFIHISWHEGSYKIYHRWSTNGGSSWTTKRLTWSSVWSYWPDIAIDSLNRIHLVWSYESIGIGEIYYRRGDQ